MIARGQTGMWVILDDFNAITHHHEKVGGPRKPQTHINNFNELINDIGMDKLGSTGLRYTWCNNPRWEDERLDKALINAQ